MNYQQLYAYLDSRPVKELQECMSNIVGLIRKRSRYDLDKISSEDDVIMVADQMHEILQKHRVAKRIWTEEAVLRKFAPRLITPAERSETLSSLLLKPEVQNHLKLVNTKIDEELHGKISTKYGLSVERNIDDDGEMCKKPLKRARTPSDVADEGRTNNWRASYDHTDGQNGNSYLANGTSATVCFSANSIETVTAPNRAKKNLQDDNKVPWDVTLDKALFDAVSRHKKDGWSAVAKAVGRGVTVDQCQRRWHRDVGPIHQGLKTGAAGWTTSEERRLGELVTLHQLPPAWNKTLQCMYDRVDWKAIGAVLGRAAASCANKWTSLQHGMMKKGSFTLAEDALIERRVAEWGDKGPGLWTQLEKEMNRSNSSIGERWKRLTQRTTEN